MFYCIKKIICFISYSLLLIHFGLCAEVQESKDLFYNTLKIKTDMGSGTGFIFDFTTDGSYPCLVTNKHVIYQKNEIDGSEKFAQEGYLNFHLTDGKNYSVKISNFYHEFKFNKQNIDLCFLPLNNSINFVNQQFVNVLQPQQSLSFQTPSMHYPPLQPSVKVSYNYINSSHLVNFNTIEPIQEILMVGYPIGLSDEVNNLPILRKGITASHIGADFQGKNEFLIDAACFPGSSGSPVFIYPGKESSYPRPRLLGILWGGPQHNVTGKIICDNETGNIVCSPIEIKKTETLIPSNLGFVIKSTELNYKNFYQ